MKLSATIHLLLLATIILAAPPSGSLGREESDNGNESKAKSYRGVGRLPGIGDNPNPSHNETRYQPDNWVGPHSRRQRGNDIYNTTGNAQSMTLTFSSRRPRRFYFTIENDCRVSDSFSVSAPRRDRRYRLSYFNLVSPPINVTATITTGQYQIGNLVPGARVPCRARVKPLRRSVHRGTSRGVYILSTSDHDSHGKDRIKANFKRH